MIFDILFLIFVAGGFWWGYQKGIIYSLFSLGAIFVGIVAALKFSYLAVSFLNTSVHLGSQVISILAFALVFVLVVLLIRIVAWALEQILKSFSLNLINQLIGGVIYSLISLYLLCVSIWFVDKWGVFPIQQKMTSHVYSYIGQLAPTVMDYSGRVVPMVKNAFADYEALLTQANNDRK